MGFEYVLHMRVTFLLLFLPIQSDLSVHLCSTVLHTSPFHNVIRLSVYIGVRVYARCECTPKYRWIGRVQLFLFCSCVCVYVCREMPKQNRIHFLTLSNVLYYRRRLLSINTKTIKGVTNFGLNNIIYINTIHEAIEMMLFCLYPTNVHY